MDARPFAAHRRGTRPKSRLVPFVTVVTLVAFVLAACGGAVATATRSPAPPISSAAPAASGPPVSPSASASPAAAFPMTVTDDEGTSVRLAAEPRRIVSLTPAATETLFALGLGTRLVGKVEDPSPYPAEAASVPDVAKFGSVDVEKIVGLGADLVIAGGSHFNPPESIQKLRSLGVPTIVVFAPDVATARKDIRLIGTATGTEARAEAIAASINAAFDEVVAAVGAEPVPRVFYELDASNGFFGPAPDYFGTEMIRDAGGDPLTSGQPGVYQIEAEKIVAFDPQVILLGDAAYGVTPAQVAARPGWETLSAVRSGSIRPIDDVIVTRPGPRLADGIRALALAIHPGLVLPGSSSAPSSGPAASAGASGAAASPSGSP